MGEWFNICRCLSGDLVALCGLPARHAPGGWRVGIFPPMKWGLPGFSYLMVTVIETFGTFPKVQAVDYDRGEVGQQRHLVEPL
jgi:hypothetical protein